MLRKKTRMAVFQINVTLLHPEDLETGLRFRLGILLIAKRLSPYGILANYNGKCPAQSCAMHLRPTAERPAVGYELGPGQFAPDSCTEFAYPFLPGTILETMPPITVGSCSWAMRSSV